MEMMSGRTEMGLTNPHSFGEPLLLWVRKISVVMVSAADVWVRRWVFCSMLNGNSPLRLGAVRSPTGRLLNWGIIIMELADKHS